MQACLFRSSVNGGAIAFGLSLADRHVGSSPISNADNTPSNRERATCVFRFVLVHAPEPHIRNRMRPTIRTRPDDELYGFGQILVFDGVPRPSGVHPGGSDISACLRDIGDRSFDLPCRIEIV
jgi:hypothetical protein